MEFICYPKCTTCIKARNWLIANNINFNERNIKENNPTKEEIIKFHQLSNLDINKLFNTSGLLYKELNLKEKLKEITLDEKYDLLASNGMLDKRPIIVLEDKVFFGFKEELLKTIL